MALVGQAQDRMSRAALGAAIVVDILLTFAILFAAPKIVARIGRDGQMIVSKVMALITAVIGIQFIINGVTTVFVDILKASRA